MKLTVSVTARTPRLHHLKYRFNQLGLTQINEMIADSLEQEILENFDEQGRKKSWAKWSKYAKSTVYKRKALGMQTTPVLSGLRSRVYKSFGATQATAGVKGKLAVYHHAGTPERTIFARDIGKGDEGGKPLWFPHPKGNVKVGRWRYFKDWAVDKHKIPARPLVPNKKRTAELAKKVVESVIHQTSFSDTP